MGSEMCIRDRIYAALSRRCGSKDEANVGIANLASITGMSRTSAKQALRKLRDVGLIEINYRDHKGQVSEYVLLDVDSLAKNTPPGEAVATRPPYAEGSRHTTTPSRHTTTPQSPHDHIRRNREKETVKEELAIDDFSMLMRSMADVRTSTVAPSLMVRMGRLDAAVHARLSAHPILRREIESLEESRAPRRPDRVR